MNILETIIAAKRLEVEKEKVETSIEVLEKSPSFNRAAFSMAGSLRNETTTGIIAEFKRKSPSKGVINGNASAAEVTRSYAEFGASALSVLTDSSFFGGSLDDFNAARTNSIPLLQKDFIIDPYQLYKAKAIGADAILLIAACLSIKEVKELAAKARSLGLEVLLELHDGNELEHICDEIELIGINNRDLRTFKVDIERSLRMAEKIPAEKIRIAESGIDSVETIRMFRREGFRGFLIGEKFMKQANPGLAFQLFAEELKKTSQS